MKNNPLGSIGVWLLVGGVAIALIMIFIYIWGKIFLVTSGLDQKQIDTYKNAIDKTNDLKRKIEQRKSNELNNYQY